MKPWIYIFITTEKLNFAKMSVTTLLHSHDDILYYETSYQIGLLLSVIVQNQILPSLHFPLDFFFSFLPPLVLTTLAAHFKKQAFLYVFPSLPHTCFFFFGHFFVHSVIKNNDVKL